MYTYRQCFTVSLKFSSICIIFSQFNGFSRSIKMEIHRDLRAVFTSMVDAFPSCRDVHNAIGQE